MTERKENINNKLKVLCIRVKIDFLFSSVIV
jgi:hypothetical protein